MSRHSGGRKVVLIFEVGEICQLEQRAGLCHNEKPCRTDEAEFKEALTTILRKKS